MANKKVWSSKRNKFGRKILLGDKDSKDPRLDYDFYLLGGLTGTSAAACLNTCSGHWLRV